MRSFTTAVLLAALVAGGPALAQSDTSLSDQDRSFTTTAMADGMLEVRLGTLAKNQGGSEAVKTFGQRMVSDHEAINRQLEAIARKHAMAPPAELPATQKTEADKLTALRGEEFDTAYMPMMVEDHQKDIEAFRKQARQGSNPELKAFAEQNVATLEQHLRQAREIHASQSVAATPKKR
jgi:putative membrane protein